MEKKEKNKLEKKTKQLIIIVIALVAVIGISYAWLTTVLNGSQTNTIKAGTLALNLEDDNGISIDPAIPMTDANGDAQEVNTTEGQSNSVYNFTLKNTGNIPAVYTIYLENDTSSLTSGAGLIADSVIKYSLRLNSGATSSGITAPTTSTTVTSSGLLSSLVGSAAGKRVLHTGTLAAGSYNSYLLKLWIADVATNSDLSDNNGAKEWGGKITVEASQENVDVPSGSHVDYTNGQTVSD